MKKLSEWKQVVKKEEKSIGDSGRPKTWVWQGEEEKFGLVRNDRLDLKENEVPAEDVDWWNSVWEFPDVNQKDIFGRVSYKEHPAQYSPMLIEQLLYRYTQPGDTVLDPMAGSGTTLMVAKFMKRNSVGVDCSRKYVKLMRNRAKTLAREFRPKILHGNAMDLQELAEESFDFVCYSPPYHNIKSYKTREEDQNLQLGSTGSKEHFLKLMRKVIQENYRVLKPGKFCACVISNIRKYKILPIAWEVGLLGEEVGFYLWDDIVHHTSHSRSKAVLRGGRWKKSIEARHTVRTHEYVLIWKKPTEEEREKIDKALGR